MTPLNAALRGNANEPEEHADGTQGGLLYCRRRNGQSPGKQKDEVMRMTSSSYNFPDFCFLIIKPISFFLCFPMMSGGLFLILPHRHTYCS